MGASFGLIVLVGCVHSTFVADIHRSEDGGIDVVTCNLDYSDRPTGYCHDEELGPFYSRSALEARAAEEIAADTPPRRPVPSAADVARAVASPGVHRLLVMCRAVHAPDLATFSTSIAIEPSGAITTDAHDVSVPFADCADRALRSANLGPYDGGPVRFEQAIDLRPSWP